MTLSFLVKGKTLTGRTYMVECYGDRNHHMYSAFADIIGISVNNLTLVIGGIRINNDNTLYDRDLLNRIPEIHIAIKDINNCQNVPVSPISNYTQDTNICN